jgi:hypothetical protein
MAGSQAENIVGTSTYQWLHDRNGASLFLQQDMELDYAGTPIKSHELIGYNPKTKAVPSHVLAAESRRGRKDQRAVRYPCDTREVASRQTEKRL